MPNPTRIEINCTTGETIEIELTDAEIAEREAQAEAFLAAKAEEEAAAYALQAEKEAIAEKIGLTLVELQTILKP